MNNNISVLISTRNSEQYINRCISSALNQNYSNFEIIFIDAQSTDKTFEIASKYKDSKLRVYRNKNRKFQLENIRIGTKLSLAGSIIVTLDGDDFFPHNNVLSTVNDIYNTYDCWMTYGTYEEYPYRDVSHHYYEYPLEVRRNKGFRQFNWLASHLRTFRRELFLKIKIEDLKDPVTNEYFIAASDLAFQFPMLEMCGENKSRHISDILYVYNRENPLSEMNIYQAEIDRVESIIRNKTPYQTLLSL